MAGVQGTCGADWGAGEAVVIDRLHVLGDSRQCPRPQFGEFEDDVVGDIVGSPRLHLGERGRRIF